MVRHCYRHTVFVLYLCGCLLSIDTSNFLHYSVCLRPTIVLYCENVSMRLIANSFSFVPVQPFLVSSMFSRLMEMFMTVCRCLVIVPSSVGPQPLMAFFFFLSLTRCWSLLVHADLSFSISSACCVTSGSMPPMGDWVIPPRMPSLHFICIYKLHFICIPALLLPRTLTSSSSVVSAKTRTNQRMSSEHFVAPYLSTSQIKYLLWLHHLLKVVVIHLHIWYAQLVILHVVLPIYTCLGHCITSFQTVALILISIPYKTLCRDGNLPSTWSDHGNVKLLWRRDLMGW